MGQPALKAHGKLWVWWSPHEQAPVFKVSLDERKTLVETEPGTFFFTAHYRNYPMVLVRPEKLDLAWARNNLVKMWRAQAPKLLLNTYDAALEGKRVRATFARRMTTGAGGKQTKPRSAEPGGQ